MKHSIYIILFLFTFSFTQVDAYTFTRTLQIGSNGEDVRELQKILNSNPLTQVSTQGAGSPGNESTYFGEKTRQAVIKFQELYAQNILSPLGFTRGTGIVGTVTLQFLNSIKNNANSTENKDLDEQIEELLKNLDEKYSSSTMTEIYKTGPDKESPIFYISEQSVQAGVWKRNTTRGGPDRILVNNKLHVGSVEKINTVSFYMNSKLMHKDKCYGDYLCIIEIDKDTPKGTYKITTDNPNWGFKEIKIIEQNIEKPQITTTKLSLKDDNLIKGEHFTPHMKVYTMFGVFKTETEDNSFILRFPSEYIKNTTSTIEGMFFIENEHGLKSNVKKIKYEI